MSFLSSFLAAVIPMTLYLFLIWRLDKYEREPLGKVIKHFLWGAIGAVILGIIFSTLLSASTQFFFSKEITLSFIGAVFIAPFVEEIVKAVYLLGSYKKNYFDNLTDGLVYGGAIGLGFGMTENLLYFTVYDENVVQWISIVITRSIFSAVMHAIATATVGASFAKAKFSLAKYKYIYPIIGLALAMFFHATWNFSVSFEFTYYLGILFMVFLIMSFFIVFLTSLKNEKKIIVNELKSETGLLELELKFQEDIKSTVKEKKVYLNTRERKNFIAFATKLAFRKLQVRNSTGNQRLVYLSEIDDIRENIKKLNEHST